MPEDLVFKTLSGIASEHKIPVTTLLLKFGMLRDNLTKFHPDKSTEFYNSEAIKIIEEMYK